MIAQNCFGKLEPWIGKYFIQKSNNRSKNNKRSGEYFLAAYLFCSFLNIFIF